MNALTFTVAALTHGVIVALYTVRAMSVLKSEAKVAVFWLDFAEPYLRQSDGMNVLLIQALQNFFLDDSVSLRVHLGSVQQICVRQT